MARFYRRESRYSGKNGFADRGLCGVFSGISVFSRLRPFLFLLMRRDFGMPVSIVGLFGVSVIPFLTTVHSVFISEP